MEKKKVKELISNFDGDYIDLCDRLIILQDVNSKFDLESLDELIFRGMYLYHLNYGIEKLKKDGSIPKLFDKVNSYDEFKMLLEKYEKIPFKNVYHSNIENAFHELVRISLARILPYDEDWMRVYSSTIYNKDIKIDGKLYISIDNSSLYQFANMLLDRCLKEGLNDFEFKLNSNKEINRRDNVVIFFNKDNLNKYLSIVHQIMKDYPQIKRNDSQLLGKELDDGVVIAKDFDNLISFTEKISKTIINLKDKKYSDNDIVDYIDNMIDNHLRDVVELVDNDTLKRHK